MELITKAKEIILYPWSGNFHPFESGEPLRLTPDWALDYVIADTLSITQDDPDEQMFEFETTDTPEAFYTAGAYKVDLNNAELSTHFVRNVMGWQYTGNGYVSPETYYQRHTALQVKFAEDCYFFLPKISIAPKLVMESVKTSLVYGTLSGTATNEIVAGKKTSICKFRTPILRIIKL